MKRTLLVFLSFILAVSLCSCRIDGDFGFSEPIWETEANAAEQDKSDIVDYSALITEDYVQSIIGAEYQTPKNVIVPSAFP